MSGTVHCTRYFNLYCLVLNPHLQVQCHST